MLKGTYNGPIEPLRGKTALVKTHKRWAFAQFDEFTLTHGGKLLSHHWHKFKKKHFKLRSFNG